MKFVLEIDMDGTELAADPAAELGRILRYWGGNLHHYDLAPGAGEAVYDSQYHEVGKWVVRTGN